MHDFARLNIYIADSNVIVTQEKEDYTSTQLVSDIGGQLGLWVGISIITLAEVLELICDLFRLLGSMTRRVPKASRGGSHPNNTYREPRVVKMNHCNNVYISAFDSGSPETHSMLSRRGQNGGVGTCRTSLR